MSTFLEDPVTISFRRPCRKLFFHPHSRPLHSNVFQWKLNHLLNPRKLDAKAFDFVIPEPSQTTVCRPHAGPYIPTSVLQSLERVDSNSLSLQQYVLLLLANTQV